MRWFGLIVTVASQIVAQVVALGILLPPLLADLSDGKTYESPEFFTPTAQLAATLAVLAGLFHGFAWASGRRLPQILAAAVVILIAAFWVFPIGLLVAISDDQFTGSPPLTSEVQAIVIVETALLAGLIVTVAVRIIVPLAMGLIRRRG